MTDFQTIATEVDPPSPQGYPHLDEIFSEGWDCHIEQMSEADYMLIFRKGECERRFWLGSKSRRAAVALYEIE